MSTVLVWIETHDGNARPTSWEALGAANALASTLGASVTALVLGKNAPAIAQDALTRGAAKALASDDASFETYRLEPYAALLSALVKEHAPLAVVAVASSAGRELLAASAADTDSAMLSDAIELGAVAGNVTVVRPVYAGKILSDAVAEGTAFVTVRARAFQPAAPVGGTGEVLTVAPVLAEASIAAKLESFEVEVGTVNLGDAAIIVSGGRGIANNPKDAPAGTDKPDVWKAKDGFETVLKPLADVLGGAVGASRAAVDAGYIDYAHQVGQTGKTVAPDLYIATAISGAIQHQAGMRNSKVIVAINKDGDAPIFKLARYGIVGDIYKIVPALTAELKKRLGK
ncbi:MAG: electron transfer flavoprotein subunit alpha/FixB family protein [Anaerolineae bacterium]|nr:electron transfer flavoprotein subunit alpha/FixB family protein [Anaerolineae bacterium]